MRTQTFNPFYLLQLSLIIDFLTISSSLMIAQSIPTHRPKKARITQYPDNNKIKGYIIGLNDNSIVLCSTLWPENHKAKFTEISIID